MARSLIIIIAVAAHMVVLPALVAAQPSSSPSPASSSAPPSPAATSVASTPSPSGSASPATNILRPPAPSLAANTVLGKIGELERAGAGPLAATAHHPHRSTSPADLKSYLDDSNPDVAARAAIAVGRLRKASGVAALSLLLQNRSAAERVKAAAAFALGVIGSPAAEGALTGALFHEASSVAGAAADSLGRIGGNDVIDSLTRALYIRDPYVRGKAAIGLGEATLLVGAPRPVDPAYRVRAGRALANAIRYERDPEVKWRMAWAIGRSLYTEDQPELRTMLTDPQELVRMFAARGVGKLKDRSYALALHLAVNDSSWRVRVEVARALAALRDNTKVDLTPPPVDASDKAQPQALPPSAPYGDHPEVAIVTTKGTIVVELFPDEAPYTVDNFLYLVDRGYYDNQQLFRVIANFVIQGGDPTNGGADGGPGYSIPAELNPIEQLTGVLAFGLDYPDNVHADVDSAGSQFYITESPQLHLDINFSTFGRVVKGMTVVDAIREHSAETPADRKKPADIVTKMYRCIPVIDQSPTTERLLRTKEIGYDAR